MVSKQSFGSSAVSLACVTSICSVQRLSLARLGFMQLFLHNLGWQSWQDVRVYVLPRFLLGVLSATSWFEGRYTPGDKLQQCVAATRCSDKSLCVYWRIFMIILPAAATECCRCSKSHKFSLIWFLRHAAATKFCCGDEDFHQNSPVHMKRFVAATCRLTVLLQLVAGPVHMEQSVAATCCCNLSPSVYRPWQLDNSLVVVFSWGYGFAFTCLVVKQLTNLAVYKLSSLAVQEIVGQAVHELSGEAVYKLNGEAVHKLKFSRHSVVNSISAGSHGTW